MDNVKHSVRQIIRLDEIFNQTRDHAANEIYKQIWCLVGNQVENRVGNQIINQIWNLNYEKK